MFEEEAKQIIEYVHKIYCFGSTNKGAAKQAAAKFQLILKAITIILLNKYPKVKKILFEDQKFSQKDIDDLYGMCEERFWTRSKVAAFKPGDTIVFLPLEQITQPDSKMLQMVKEVYPPDKFNWNEESVDGLIAILADYLSQWDKIKDKFSKPAAKIYKLFNSPQYIDEKKVTDSFYNPGIQPVTKEDRNLFLKQMLKEVRESIMYGVGECGLMADLAFINAAYSDLTCNITYIRFINKDNAEVEECNAIVLGDWPKPGCLIVSPWQGNGEYYTWNGSIHKTPQITRLNNYNYVKVIFKMLANSEEIADFRQMIKEKGYSSWLEDPKRLEKLAEIRDQHDALKTSLLALEYLPVAQTNVSDNQLKI